MELNICCRMAIQSKHSVVLFNLHEQEECEFVDFSDLSNKWVDCTTIISTDTSLDQKKKKPLMYEESSKTQ